MSETERLLREMDESEAKERKHLAKLTRVRLVIPQDRIMKAMRLLEDGSNSDDAA